MEREIKEIMVADNCDQSTAAQSLLDNIGNAPPLVPIIRRYIHCRQTSLFGGNLARAFGGS